MTQEEIAAESRLCSRTVRYALGKLEDDFVTSRVCLEDAASRSTLSGTDHSLPRSTRTDRLLGTTTIVLECAGGDAAAVDTNERPICPSLTRGHRAFPRETPQNSRGAPVSSLTELSVPINRQIQPERALVIV